MLVVGRKLQIGAFAKGGALAPTIPTASTENVLQDSVSFEAFCQRKGFQTYPFNSFTAENEQDKQAHLFISTKVYSPLFEAFEAGQTMILCGDRGTGKTAITYDFSRRTSKDSLVCQIDDFSTLPLRFSEGEFYKFVLTCAVNRFLQSFRI